MVSVAESEVFLRCILGWSMPMERHERVAPNLCLSPQLDPLSALVARKISAIAVTSDIVTARVMRQSLAAQDHCNVIQAHELTSKSTFLALSWGSQCRIWIYTTSQDIRASYHKGHHGRGGGMLMLELGTSKQNAWFKQSAELETRLGSHHSQVRSATLHPAR
jgi:hypothetical protein